MKTLLSLAILAIASCVSPAPSWNAFQPLDTPGTPEPTAAELHEANMRSIVGPSYIAP